MAEEKSNRELAYSVREITQRHHAWLNECLPMIASENVTSHLVREVLASDLSHRYAEGLPGKRFYQGCKYIDELEDLAINLAKKLFGAKFVNVQPTSGVIANLATYHAFLKPRDKLLSLAVLAGGHISHSRISAAGVMDLNVSTFPFDANEMNIDVDKAKKLILQEKPKMLLFGASVLLFPHPVNELREAAKSVGALIAYDAAHVLGLIAGKEFQQPLKEGADVMPSSRHKTFPGPQGGIIFSMNEGHAKKIDKAVFPGLVSNHHIHHLAGLAIALAEMLEFGEAYARQIVKNARALGEALYALDFDVLCEHKGFTSSHQLVVDVKKFGGGTPVAERLEQENIIINKNLMPYDDINTAQNPGGIRIGVQELTRLGMREGEMKQVAEFINKAVKNKNIKKEVAEFRREFTTVKYCFNEKEEAYKYINFEKI